MEENLSILICKACTMQGNGHERHKRDENFKKKYQQVKKNQKLTLGKLLYSLDVIVFICKTKSVRREP